MILPGRQYAETDGVAQLNDDYSEVLKYISVIPQLNSNKN
jgi:hypothetical protein